MKGCFKMGINVANVSSSQVVDAKNSGTKQNRLAFKQGEEQDSFETTTYTKKARAGKKWCIGLMSLAPGLGHFANGQLGKSLLTWLGIIAGRVGLFSSIALYAKNKYVGIATAIASGALALGTYIWSIVDSVKNCTKNIDIVKTTVDSDGFVEEKKIG